MGIDQAEKAFDSGYARFPTLYLKAGDRAHFHFLSTGHDEFFSGGRFHQIPGVTAGGKQFTREVLCLRAYTDGDESCGLCDQGHDDLANRFAVWTFTHSIYHLGDNPDEEGERWAQRQASGSKRIVFEETVEKPLLLRSKVGKQHKWFAQFKAAVNKFGTLEDRLYEFKRVGSSMDDTDYFLSVVKEVKLEAEVRKGLEIPTIEDIFRSSTGRSVSVPRLSTGLDGEGETDEIVPLGDENLAVVEEGGESLI